MPGYYDDEPPVGEEEMLDHDYDSDHSCDNGDDSDTESHLYANNEQDLLLQEYRRHVEWKNLRVGETTLQISSEGAIKRTSSWFEPSSYGFALLGTPYRTYPIDDKEYLVHELVWLAFHGPPPPGWCVRHKYSYTRYKKRQMYSNALDVLDISPTILGTIPHT